MEMTDAKVVEKKIYEEGKKEYASKGLAGTALGIGIGGLALALLNGNGRGVFGSLGNGMPDNVNINTYGGMTASNTAPTALEVMEKECDDEVKLLTCMFGMKLDTANKFYAMRETDIAEYSHSGNKKIAMTDKDGNTLKTYDSIKDAVVELGINRSSLQEVLSGRQKSTKGMYFTYC